VQFNKFTLFNSLSNYFNINITWTMFLYGRLYVVVTEIWVYRCDIDAVIFARFFFQTINDWLTLRHVCRPTDLNHTHRIQCPAIMWPHSDTNATFNVTCSSIQGPGHNHKCVQPGATNRWQWNSNFLQICVHHVQVYHLARPSQLNDVRKHYSPINTLKPTCGYYT